MNLIETDHDRDLQHDLEKIAQFQQRRRTLIIGIPVQVTVDLLRFLRLQYLS